MSSEIPHSYILFRLSADNLRAARESRVRRRELVAELRKEAEEEAVAEPAQVQLMITNEMRQALADLGWDKEDIKKMTPQQAKDILDENYTKKQKEESDSRREELLDDYDEKVHRELQKAKKRLEILQKKYKATEDFVDKLYNTVAELEEKSDGSDLARKRLLKHEQHREDMEKALNSIEEQIRAQNHLVQRIIDQEEGLLEDLQEVNEVATATPGPEDDALLEERVKERSKYLDEIHDLRKQLAKKHQAYEQTLNKLIRLRKEQGEAFHSPKWLHLVNELDDEADQVQSELDEVEKQVASLIRSIDKKENSLRSEQVEQALQSIEQEYSNLPDFEDIREKSKQEIEQEDPGQELAQKPKFYKDRSEAISSFVQKYEPQFRDFVVNFIGPDIPSDPKVEKALTVTNQGIIKRSLEMQKLADRYKRNDMHRSAILLPAVLYEMLAKNMQAVLEADQEEAEAQAKEAQAIYADLVEAGLLKEAITLDDLMDAAGATGRGIGKGVRGLGKGLKGLGRGLGKAYEKGKELSEQASEALDRRRFDKQDEAPRRDFGKPLDEARKNLQQLVSVERDLKMRLEHAKELLDEATKASPQDPTELRRIRDTIREIQQKIQEVGERKNVMEHGLKHLPAHGVMRGQEQASRSPKSDFQHAVALMEEAKPDLVRYLALIPDDAGLEKELLRQSDRIARLVNKLIQIGFKSKSKYPNLPPTIQAYGHMFLAIDDALDRALRSNEGVA